MKIIFLFLCICLIQVNGEVMLMNVAERIADFKANMANSLKRFEHNLKMDELKRLQQQKNKIRSHLKWSILNDFYTPYF